MPGSTLRRFILPFICLAVLVASVGVMPAAADETATDDYLLVFFINPNGGPCQMQNAILSEMGDELNGKVMIRPVQTTVDADRRLFYAYAIRGLPTLILTDATGKEIRRLPPGVQSATAVRELLSFIPEN
ncbi:MAG: hypothetical protein C0622_11290 [Desulfuromonas sp.]|nr:MAG: hypothetical protein C0622_11290 [Desulfuromonas sp.]